MTWSRLALIATLVLLIVPVVLGLVGTLLPAFGYLPVLGSRDFSLAPWQTLLSYPGVGHAMLLSLWSGLAATALSLTFALLLAFYAWPGGHLRRLQRLFSPVLATPHAAMTIGVLFLLAPSGWLIRLLSPTVTGWSRPPDLLTVQDPLALTLILALVLKAVPYLLWMTTAALSQLDVDRTEQLARSLGYSRLMAWRKLLLPQLYPLLRLPVYAELAFTVAVVDVALIIGPVTPPTFAALLLEWFQQPDLDWRLPASAGAIALLLLVLVAIGLWELGLWLWRRYRRNWLSDGQRGKPRPGLNRLIATIQGVLLGLPLLAMIPLLLWSLARRWRFPDTLPSTWSLATWERYLPQLTGPVFNSLGLALLTSLLATLLVIGTLEWEVVRRRPIGRGLQLAFYLPLLLPQLAFLFGVQVLWIHLHIDSSYLAVLLSHLLFVLPYVWLSLAAPYRHFDNRYFAVALSLGRSPLSALWQIKLPMLKAPILAAFTIGVLVSLAQYLATVFAGGGRITTLTTEAVTLATGGNRKATGLYALLLVLLPLILLAVTKRLTRSRQHEQ